SHIAVGAVAIAGNDVFVEFGAGQDHHGDVLGSLVGPQPAQHLQPVDLGQLQVEQDEAGRRYVAAFGEEKSQGLGTVVGYRDFVEDLVSLQGPDRQGLVVGIVLDQQ